MTTNVPIGVSTPTHNAEIRVNPSGKDHHGLDDDIAVTIDTASSSQTISSGVDGKTNIQERFLSVRK